MPKDRQKPRLPVQQAAAAEAQPRGAADGGAGKPQQRHARCLLSLESEEEQLQLIDRIVREGWSVRQAEAFVVKAAPRPKPLRVLRLTKDCRLFLNGLDTLLDQLRQAGIRADMETEKHPDGLNVIIRVNYGQK